MVLFLQKFLKINATFAFYLSRVFLLSFSFALAKVCFSFRRLI
ncbi:hypothetical protein HMPREF3187_01699 [Aerococcus christensenii]|uniref:Uncharacterized protein n=1 Tax=Aerococcus christensenii TaxID=87541 RepID=A0A133XR59_9LACT|nr:hypothetical protein HMPREF3187_01699 [Aerococcus christensenii]